MSRIDLSPQTHIDIPKSSLIEKNKDPFVNSMIQVSKGKYLVFNLNSKNLYLYHMKTGKIKSKSLISVFMTKTLDKK